MSDSPHDNLNPPQSHPWLSGLILDASVYLVSLPQPSRPSSSKPQNFNYWASLWRHSVYVVALLYWSPESCFHLSLQLDGKSVQEKAHVLCSHCSVMNRGPRRGSSSLQIPALTLFTVHTGANCKTSLRLSSPTQTVSTQLHARPLDIQTIE